MASMKRYLKQFIAEDIDTKIVLITGPRQTGKTTLSKMFSDSIDYLNYDNSDHRINFLNKSWDRSKQVIIFDELHKLKNWKSWLKGIYDTESIPPSIIVTGSAKLDTYKKVGDSLAGRFFQFRLHPLDLKELKNHQTNADSELNLERMMEIGGFPEPFFRGTKRFYNRWKKSHLDIMLKQDLVDLENIQQISSIETLIQLLRRKVGSPISYQNLANDLQCSDKTVKRWLQILENMYVIFRVTPYHHKIARSILKSPKYYFYDTGQVIGDSGIKLENTVACALLKEIHFREDCFGEERRLYYLRNRQKKELDFLVTRDEFASHMIEVKLSEDSPSKSFGMFGNFLPGVKMIQLVKNLKREKTFPNGIEVRSASSWLSNFMLDH